MIKGVFFGIYHVVADLTCKKGTLVTFRKSKHGLLLHFHCSYFFYASGNRVFILVLTFFLLFVTPHLANELLWYCSWRCCCHISNIKRCPVMDFQHTSSSMQLDPVPPQPCIYQQWEHRHKQSRTKATVSSINQSLNATRPSILWVAHQIRCKKR